MAIAKLVQEDPTLHVSTDPDTGQTILAGMGELHLEIIVDRMQREFNVGANVGKPQVAYRETIRQMSRIRLHAQEADRRQRPIRPREAARASRSPGKGFEFENEVTRRQHSEGIHSGHSEGRGRGARSTAFWPAIRCRTSRSPCSTATITTSIRRKWRSRSALRFASRKRARKAKPVLLEPVMRVEVVVPDEYMGSVNGDLISRRGRLEGTEIRGTTHIIKAMVPLSEMFGYATELRSRTQGRGAFHHAFRPVRGSSQEHRRGDRQQGARQGSEIGSESHSDSGDRETPWRRKNSIAANRT